MKVYPWYNFLQFTLQNLVKPNLLALNYSDLISLPTVFSLYKWQPEVKKDTYKKKCKSKTTSYIFMNLTMAACKISEQIYWLFIYITNQCKTYDLIVHGKTNQPLHHNEEEKLINIEPFFKKHIFLLKPNQLCNLYGKKAWEEILNQIQSINIFVSF